MNKKEKYALFAQFAEFLMNIHELLGFLKKSDNRRVKELVPAIEHTLKEYYLNFDTCDQCGHPIPPLPSMNRMHELEESLQKYITRYENKTGDIPLIEMEEKPSSGVTRIDENLPPALQGIQLDKDAISGKTVDEILSNFLKTANPEQAIDEEEEPSPKKKKLIVSSRLAELAEKDKKPVYHGKLISIE